WQCFGYRTKDAPGHCGLTAPTWPCGRLIGLVASPVGRVCQVDAPLCSGIVHCDEPRGVARPPNPGGRRSAAGTAAQRGLWLRSPSHRSRILQTLGKIGQPLRQDREWLVLGAAPYARLRTSPLFIAESERLHLRARSP